MPKLERVALWLTIAALGVAVGMLATDQADLDARLSAPPTTTTSTSTTLPADPLAAEFLKLKAEVTELQAHRGLTGPQVRALVETLLPKETCPEPPCSDLPPTTAKAAPATSAKPMPPTTEKQRGRR